MNTNIAVPHFNNTPKLNLDNTIVLEVCQNCKSHGWNTRHDAAKYYNYATTSKSFSYAILYSGQMYYRQKEERYNSLQLGSKGMGDGGYLLPAHSQRRQGGAVL
jgi:hypothetical protein